MNGGKTNNDKLGLCGVQYEVPPSGPRPQSAIEWDRKGGLAIDTEIHSQAEYWRLREEGNRKRHSRSHDASKTDEQV